MVGFDDLVPRFGVRALPLISEAAALRPANMKSFVGLMMPDFTLPTRRGPWSASSPRSSMPG